MYEIILILLVEIMCIVFVIGNIERYKNWKEQDAIWKVILIHSGLGLIAFTIMTLVTLINLIS